MNEKTQDEKVKNQKASYRPRYIVGMDAHSKKLAISIWECTDPWHPILYKENKNCAINNMERYYENEVPPDSITIIEASTNSAILKNMLNDLGFRAEVVRSDTIANKQRKRKICDIQDARKLAYAYIHGDIDEFIWTPAPEYDEYRDILFSYRDAVKEVTRVSNRIWAICSRKGFDIEIKAGETKVASIREMISQLNLTGFLKDRLEMLANDYEYYLTRREELIKVIAKIVLDNQTMMSLMQLPGINFLAAFATQTIVEDARRFSSASKLAAYGGFAMINNTSGEEEEKSKARGGTGKPLDGEGRRDLKVFYCEAGHTVLNRCADMAIGKWGWRLVFKGKHKNVAACAVARKLLNYAWHIMRGDPTPNRESEGLYKRKMLRFHNVLGSQYVKNAGFLSSKDFASKMAERLYGNLPKAK